MDFQDLVREAVTPGARTKSKEQIRKDHAGLKGQKTHISPNFGDGGWHTTPGCQIFTTEWEPRNDRILVRLDEEAEQKGSILLPDIAARQSLTRIGTVLKVGPGRWIPGTWWMFQQPTPHWEWIPGEREEMLVQTGMRVVIGKWTDWESTDAGWGQNVVICQQGDVRGLRSWGTITEEAVRGWLRK